jgi:hypothetical protein
MVTADLVVNLLKWSKELSGQPFKINKKLCSHLKSLLSNKAIFGEQLKK